MFKYSWGYEGEGVVALAGWQWGRGALASLAEDCHYPESKTGSIKIFILHILSDKK